MGQRVAATVSPKGEQGGWLDYQNRWVAATESSRWMASAIYLTGHESLSILIGPVPVLSHSDALE
jgi:hypothetical protein